MAHEFNSAESLRKFNYPLMLLSDWHHFLDLILRFLLSWIILLMLYEEQWLYSSGNIYHECTNTALRNNILILATIRKNSLDISIPSHHYSQSVPEFFLWKIGRQIVNAKTKTNGKRLETKRKIFYGSFKPRLRCLQRLRGRPKYMRMSNLDMTIQWKPN